MPLPWAPKKPCCWPGCGRLADGRYCDRHAKADRKEHDRRRGSSAKRGYGYRWQRYSKQYLRVHPLCVRCEAAGQVEASTDVDHVTPVSGPADPLFWDPTNHQALCHGCHSAKTATEDGGFGRPTLAHRVGGSNL